MDFRIIGQHNKETPKKPTQLPPLTLLIFTTFSHSSSFTITPTLPTPYPFPDHHSLYLLPFTPSILAPCSIHLTSCKQHISIILFLSSSHTSTHFPLSPPIYHIPIHTAISANHASCHTASHACVPKDEGLHHHPYHGRQVPATPTFRQNGAYNNRLP